MLLDAQMVARQGMVRRYFTFIELLAICVIIGLLSAMVLPRINGSSRRMVVEQALSNLRGAFSQTAVASRASGEPLALVLNPEGSAFTVMALENSLERDWRPPRLAKKANHSAEEGGDEGEDSTSQGILSGAASYDVPSEVEWVDLPEIEGDQPGIVFCFFPDGGASGPELHFMLAKVEYGLAVDAVTGKVDIWEGQVE